MKTKFFFFLAMLLMSSVGAFAQSETNKPLKGDLNEDGEVDAADVVVLVDIIMKKNVDSNKYYWYAGTTLPSESNINSIATGSETSRPNWTADNPQSIAATNNTDEAQPLYYCFPTEWNVVTLDVNKTNIIELVNEGTFTYNGTEYTVLRTGRNIAVGTTKNYWAKCDNITDPEPTYYWYAGTTLPDASNINTIGTSETSKPNWTADNPQSLAVTNNTGESTFIYYCFPTTWNVTMLDVNKSDELSMATEGTFTYNNVEYTILRQGRQTANGATKEFWAKCDNDIFYWYIGVDNPSYISNIQTDNTVPGWHEIGSSLSGFVLDTNTNNVILDANEPTPFTNPVLYYVVIPTGLNIYDSDDASADYLFDPVSCSISGYKAYKYNDVPGYSVKGIILKQ